MVNEEKERELATGEAASPATESEAPAEPNEQDADQAAPIEQVDTVESLRAQLETERVERQAAEDRVLRLRADFENLRRRTMQEAEQMRSNLTQEIVGRLLPVLDDLDRALATAADDVPSAGWVEGLEIIKRGFLTVLADYGLTRLEVVGQVFDPAMHEAMMRVEDSGQPANTIVEELRPGYALGDRIIRPAMVKVQG